MPRYEPPKSREGKVPLTVFVEPEFRSAVHTLARAMGMPTQELMTLLTEQALENAQNDPALKTALEMPAAQHETLKKKAVAALVSGGS